MEGIADHDTIVIDRRDKLVLNLVEIYAPARKKRLREPVKYCSNATAEE